MPPLIEGDRVGSIITAFYTVYNYYGSGFAEAVYAGALERELVDHGHEVARELAVDVRYKGHHVAWQRLDMVVDGRVLVEIKAGDKLPPYAERQLRNYLCATTFEVGVLLHFGPRAFFGRYIDYPKRQANASAAGSVGTDLGTNQTNENESMTDGELIRSDASALSRLGTDLGHESNE